MSLEVFPPNYKLNMFPEISDFIPQEVKNSSIVNSPFSFVMNFFDNLLYLPASLTIDIARWTVSQIPQNAVTDYIERDKWSNASELKLDNIHQLLTPFPFLNYFYLMKTFYSRKIHEYLQNKTSSEIYCENIAKYIQNNFFTVNSKNNSGKISIKSSTVLDTLEKNILKVFKSAKPTLFTTKSSISEKDYRIYIFSLIAKEALPWSVRAYLFYEMNAFIHSFGFYQALPNWGQYLLSFLFSNTNSEFIFSTLTLSFIFGAYLWLKQPVYIEKIIHQSRGGLTSLQIEEVLSNKNIDDIASKIKSTASLSSSNITILKKKLKDLRNEKDLAISTSLFPQLEFFEVSLPIIEEGNGKVLREKSSNDKSFKIEKLEKEIKEQEEKQENETKNSSEYFKKTDKLLDLKIYLAVQNRQFTDIPKLYEDKINNLISSFEVQNKIKDCIERLKAFKKEFAERNKEKKYKCIPYDKLVTIVEKKIKEQEMNLVEEISFEDLIINTSY